MDIEIKNESQALNICGNAKSDKIKQLNSHISTLNSLINKIKVNWSSTGSDQASYIAELEKQANNLQEISNQSYRFFDVIERYVDSTQKTSQRTVGSGGSSSGGSSSGGGGGAAAGAAAGAVSGATQAIKQTANSMAGLANGGSSSGGKGSTSASSSGTVKPTLDPGVPNTNGNGIVGTATGSLTTVTPSTGGSSGSGGGSSYTGGGSSGGTSGGSSTISSVHGNGNGTSALGGTSGKTVGPNGEVASTSSGLSSTSSSGGISSAAGTSGTVTTAASEIFTSDKLDGVVPKLSVPMGSGTKTGSKAVPIVSGGIAAGAVGLGAAAILKKAPAAKPEKNLEIDAWEETKEAQVEPEASTMEQKLGELTFEDIIM